MLRTSAATLLLFASSASAAPAEDEVTKLPGYTDPSGAGLRSKHYSGYLPCGNLTGVPGMLHYWFIEAETDSSFAPVVLWLNGGPGSSSLIGLLTENGQVATNVNSLVPEGQVPKVFYNPYSWSQVANVVYLEQPKGVGFSYCTGGSKKCRNTDESTAADSYEALVSFFNDKFPEYKDNDFYLTGESYAGTYIPMIMDVADKHQGLPNMKGAAIGNGCYGNSIGLCGNSHYEKRVDAEIFSGHAMYPLTLYRQIQQQCPSNYTLKPSKACEALYSKMSDSLGNFNVYNIYDQCPASSSGAATSTGLAASKPSYTLAQLQEARAELRGSAANKKRSWRVTGLAASLHPLPALNAQMGGALNDWLCGGEQGMGAWLADPAVQEALHVSGHANSQMDYDSTVDDLRPVYKRLAMKYRMMIYSGDVDACVPYYASEDWTRELGFKVAEEWRPWTAPSLDGPKDDSIRAGYTIRYDTGAGHNFTFATIAGAGHMAPTFKPPQALAMLRRFLANQPL